MIAKEGIYMADVGAIKSSQEIQVFGIFGSGNIHGVGAVSNTENTKYDQVASLADDKSNGQNRAQKKFDPHGVYFIA